MVVLSIVSPHYNAVMEITVNSIMSWLQLR